MSKRVPTGYEDRKPKANKQRRRKNYVGSLIIADKKKIGIFERIIKILIYFALRLVIKPSKWRESEKNYELIDRVYKRVMGSDFVYIPSSIAFYIVMAFMPVLAVIALVSTIPGLDGVFGTNDVKQVLGKFIPGISSIIDNVAKLFNNKSSSSAAHILGISGTAILYALSIWISSAGMAKLVFTQSYIYGHKYKGGWWMNRFKGMLIVIGLMVLLIIALMINIQVDNLISMITKNQLLVQTLQYIFLILALFILLFLLFAFFFKITPRFQLKFKEVIPGAMVSAVAIAFFLSLFTFFSGNISYQVYGYISALMYVCLISIWISIFIFLGITTNAAYFRTHVSDKPRFKWTLSKK